MLAYKMSTYALVAAHVTVSTLSLSYNLSNGSTGHQVHHWKLGWGGQIAMSTKGSPDRGAVIVLSLQSPPMRHLSFQRIASPLVVLELVGPLVALIWGG